MAFRISHEHFKAYIELNKIFRLNFILSKKTTVSTSTRYIIFMCYLTSFRTHKIFKLEIVF